MAVTKTIFRARYTSIALPKTAATIHAQNQIRLRLKTKRESMWRMLKQVCGRREDEKRRASEGVEDGVCDHDYLDDKYR